MGPLDRLRELGLATPVKIALPEGTDRRIVRAAAAVVQEGYPIHPVLVGDRSELAAATAQFGEGVELEIVDPRELEGAPWADEATNVDPRDPLICAGLLLRAGEVEGAVCGAVVSTADTIRLALRVVGLEPGSLLLSSCFWMAFPDGRSWIYSDGGVVPDPTAEQLAEIARAAAQSCRVLLGEVPRVALLSFSTHGSADHPRVEKVRQAVQHLRQSEVDFVFDGELQVDAAIVPEVAQRKAPDSPLEGRANVLVFPDLDAGNIGYKLTERLAGARAIGPLLQGVSKPLHDLSRGCSEEDVMEVMAVAAMGAASRRQESAA